MFETFRHGYAVLIGVGNSSYEKWSLPVTVKDIQALHAVLVDRQLSRYPNDKDHLWMLSNAGATRKAISVCSGPRISKEAHHSPLTFQLFDSRLPFDEPSPD